MDAPIARPEEPAWVAQVARRHDDFARMRLSLDGCRDACAFASARGALLKRTSVRLRRASEAALDRAAAACAVPPEARAPRGEARAARVRARRRALAPWPVAPDGGPRRLAP